jgi:hypothetical protein
MAEEAERPKFTFWKSGKDVLIHHGNTLAATLRGKPADKFLAKLERLSEEEQQAVMARTTGNYKRGNERTGKNHPRNRW